MDEQQYQANTVASAIEIGRPVNLPKALRSLDVMDGVVREVSDEEILEARALVGRYGFGCEPASGASVAGLQKLLAEQVISPSDSVACILTGHELKDPNATVKYHTGLDMKTVQDLAPRVEPHGKLSNRPVPVEDTLEAIVAAMGGDASMIQGVKVAVTAGAGAGHGKPAVPVAEY
jgi:threonine synthase